MQIQWYPGHMAKARRLLAESLRLVDVVVELADARAPLASQNPDFDDLFQDKPRVYLLNKADLADEETTRCWTAYFRKRGFAAIPFSASTGKGQAQAVRAIEQAAKPVVERYLQKGVKKTVRAMVVGIPNVGKSSFINRLKGSASAKAGDRPGVTRGKQWIVLTPYLELLDTPGLLWPKLDDQRAALRLAYLGAIREEIMDLQRLSASLLGQLCRLRPEAVAQRYRIRDLDAEEDSLLEMACRGRGWLQKGGLPDLERGAQIVLDEFRGGKLGRISLESPEEEEHGPEGERAGAPAENDAH